MKRPIILFSLMNYLRETGYDLNNCEIIERVGEGSATVSTEDGTTISIEYIYKNWIHGGK